nr:sporulation protein [Kineosporia mesophila]
MLGALGVGGPKVDTVLSQPGAQPGGILTGQVNLVGGGADVQIEHINLGLITRMEIESGHGDRDAVGEFHRVAVSGPMRLAEGQNLSLPFQIVLPWETPITAVYGQSLHGMVMGVRTEVAIARAVDKGDLDPVQVHALPVQERILDAFLKLGFVFKSADLEYGQIMGAQQTLPFYQEIEFFPAQQYAHAINEVELTFVTGPHAVQVVLELDKRGGLFRSGQDSYGRYTVSHADAESTDWAGTVDGWIRQAIEGRQSMAGHSGGFGGGYGAPSYGRGAGFGGGHGQYGHHDQHRSSGMGGLGGVAMGVAGGLAAGYVANEVMEEIFEDDSEDEGGGEED